MLSSKTKTTKRKFYNKWLYKVSLDVKGVGIFRVKSLAEVKDFCLKADINNYRSYTLLFKTLANKTQICNLADFLMPYDSSSWTKRIESNIIDFYTNDADFYEALSLAHSSSVIHRFAPDINSLDLLASNENILVSKLPHNKYNYKVFLQPHKMAKDIDNKIKFIDWVERQTPRITCSSAIKTWFIETNWNWDRRYVLVEDEQTLLMMKLRGPEVVGRIYNYVVCDK